MALQFFTGYVIEKSLSVDNDFIFVLIFSVYTSNVFAILGLRSLYFLLAGSMQRFAYLKIGLAAVLVFVGAKMLVAGVYHVPIAVSLGVIALILTSAIVASLLRTREAPGARVTQTAPAHRGDQQDRPRRAAR